MKSVLNEEGLKDLLSRLNKLKPGKGPEWGTMDAAQMLAHVTVSIKLALNEIEPEYNERYLEIGNLVRDRLFDSEVFTKNVPTTIEFVKTGFEDFAKNKAEFIKYLNRVKEIGQNYTATGKHPYFGKLNPDEWGKLIYKHTNHHFIQFGI